MSKNVSNASRLYTKLYASSPFPQNIQRNTKSFQSLFILKLTIQPHEMT